MIFNSYVFILFFVAVVSLYFSIPHKYRWIPLLGASYYFYMCWKPEYVIILAGATLVDYWIAPVMAKTSTPIVRKRFLILSLFLNVGVLFLFKYFNFFGESLEALLSRFNIMVNMPSFRLLLPVGISYYTFKKISYIVDVYRGHREPETHLGKFALYVSFFPELAAGPIDRSGDLLPQFHQHHHLEYERVINGLKLIVWGMFKKVVVADRLAVFVDQVYNRPFDYQGISLAAATLFFSIRIYADFSGYTDMAIGIGQVMGFRLADNFNRPYFAKSITEFWRRWHISFTTWLRDYLFLPIAYAVSRKIKTPALWHIKGESWAYVTGTMVTMLLCGLWHGAGWTFVVWGGLHGLYLVISFATRKTRKKLRKKFIKPFLKKPYRFLRVLFTFSVVSFLWVFFRANSLSDAAYIASRIFNPRDWAAFTLEKEWLKTTILMGHSKQEFLIAVLAVVFMLLVHAIQQHEGMRRMLSQKPLILRWALYILLTLAVMNLGQVKEIPFIYAEF
jgi:alginate O-acetyltransferase complex protein AlgI